MKNFFHKPATGVNADLARHAQTQKEVELRIAEAEEVIELDPSDEFAVTALRTYREILNQLMESRVYVISKLGRK